ncbi:DUF4352 domain-containing protein [Eubacterium multiforme]|uniref:DUF4352 domain-containing protein n=1 Tax=Eubacterium multiforme TaxID=83339 RepID=A0ABT9USB5_9FIRM|nr:DUF4352 domain-containing protein [Eubacterium multiforme]MDQ0149208.1 hypothetical protein [Eubacterium multiforme]
MDKIKKPIYKKWWFWLIIIVIILIAIGSSGSSSSDNSNNKSQSQTQESKNKVVKLNEQSKIGDVGVKVLKVKETKNISNEAGKSKANGKFIIIELSLKNESKDPIQYDSHDFTLNNDGKSYEIDDNSFDASGNMNSQQSIYNNNKDFIGVYDKFNPGITKKTYLVFDVPKDLDLSKTNLVIAQDDDIQFALK